MPATIPYTRLLDAQKLGIQLCRRAASITRTIPAAAVSPAGGTNPIKEFQEFELEAWQSRYEMEVAYNVADSGVQPVRLDELVRGPEALQQLLSTELHYPAVGGPPALRRLIADWQGAAPDDILVTCGAAEANSIAVSAILGVEAGAHAVVMEPCYRQAGCCMFGVAA